MNGDEGRRKEEEEYSGLDLLTAEQKREGAQARMGVKRTGVGMVIKEVKQILEW